nr:immunoglobulin light chain junction region [Macaca mulatta]MOX87027.1 immunoglobulin light chain junction region [Macaca mulatta]MOX87436.1 immunoglobulin light chain junction region [Macaca mulatta]MOX88356.1 immunoglobulin light chain junction region [Macaca mulatta]MOX88424.1 immunoglobulin light chain junction region [Macaca mulatta]
CLQYSNDPLTF